MAASNLELGNVYVRQPDDGRYHFIVQIDESTVPPTFSQFSFRRPQTDTPFPDPIDPNAPPPLLPFSVGSGHQIKEIGNVVKQMSEDEGAASYREGLPASMPDNLKDDAVLAFRSDWGIRR